MRWVPEWKEGTYYGNPIYYTKDTYMDAEPEEFYMHTYYKKTVIPDYMERHFH